MGSFIPEEVRNDLLLDRRITLALRSKNLKKQMSAGRAKITKLHVKEISRVRFGRLDVEP